MQTTSYRRPAAIALLLASFTLAAAGCDRRPTDPTTPSATPGTTTTTPSTGMGSTSADSAASAASR